METSLFHAAFQGLINIMQLKVFLAMLAGVGIGTFTLMVAIPLARPLIYLMGSPELFVVMLWGLSMIAVLAGRRPIKGLIAAVFGLLLATVEEGLGSGLWILDFSLHLF